MADAAVGFLLENLTQLLLYNADLVSDVKDQIAGLHKELLFFKAFLRDSIEMRRKNNRLEVIVENIRSVVYKAEDVIDKYVVAKFNLKEETRIKKTMRVLAPSSTIKDIAEDIESIRRDVRQIYHQKRFGYEDLQLEDLPNRGSTHNKQQPPVVEEENVVGFDEAAKDIFRFLNGKDKGLDILTIVGMPGLGKTTLARKVYNDAETEYNFFSRAWVYVSQRYTRREVFLSLFNSLTQTSHPEDMEENQILEALQSFLENEKYLIVLDDVWTKEDWLALKNAFPRSNKGSRILITSRHKEVALHANPNRLHMLNFLTPEHSWELLEIKVYGKQKCPEELQECGKEIAIKCEGLPLAIVVIAGILLNDRDSSENWKQVAENVKSFIIKDERQFMDVIRWSYNHLPHYLRSCFLYLGVFPKHYVIPVLKLIRLWIAEGFIEESEERRLEDIAEGCVKDLVNRSLLMVMERRSNGEIKTCRVHDMLYDFCTKEAQIENLYGEIKRPTEVGSQQYRRICIHGKVLEYVKEKPQGEQVRSFICYPPKEIKLPRQLISVIPKVFELLRVLDAESINFESFPKNILGLILLRYLALSCNTSTLPPNISKLWNIQTLIFMTSSKTLDMKEGLWKLYQLRHLRTNASCLLPRLSDKSKGKAMENVQSLSMIAPESCTNEVFARTPNIKKLGVKGNLVVLFDEFDSVGKLRHLTNLKLINDDESTADANKITRLPSPYKFPKNLKKLTLSETWLEWEHMQTLGELEKLEFLKLKDNAFHGELWTPKGGGFLSLKLLHIGRTNLVSWNASKHHFPSLKRLVLQHCEELMAVPVDLAEVASFQILELFRTPKAAKSAKEIQDRKMSKATEDTKVDGGFKLSIYPPEL